MNPKEKLRKYLIAAYRKKTSGSRAIFKTAERVMVRGGSHTIRLWKPYPFFADKALGSRVIDVDGRSYIDYWQGHYANVLGHNPPRILRKSAALLRRGGLHTGFEARHQVELADLILSQLGRSGDKVRFTTSGTLATMYAVMLAQGRTERNFILKVGGGWHGASPYLLKGIKHRRANGFNGMESSGVSKDIMRKTLVTRFNDCEALCRIFKASGDRIACFIVEPFLGVGGFLPASKEYLKLARDLTRKHGALLIFDEIISGFRFCPSAVQTLYGIRPDLTTFGKLIGGGHAVSAVVGKKEIMEACEGSGPASRRVLFEGGTFSSHSEYMLAGLTMLFHLVQHSETVYPRLARSGDFLRTKLENVFRGEGIPARCTGWGNDVVPGSSLFMVHFPRREGRILSPEDLHDGRLMDVELREEILKLALLVHGVNVVHGGGAISTSHKKEDLERTVSAYGEAARLFKKYLY